MARVIIFNNFKLVHELFEKQARSVNALGHRTCTESVSRCKLCGIYLTVEAELYGVILHTIPARYIKFPGSVKYEVEGVTTDNYYDERGRTCVTPSESWTNAARQK